MSGLLKKMVIAISVMAFIVGCSLSAEQIGETTKISMQQTFDTDEQFKELHLRVSGVQVLKQSDNRYQGIAAVVYDGISHDIAVEITADGSNVIWKVEPGAFTFIVQKQLQDMPDIFQ